MSAAELVYSSGSRADPAKAASVPEYFDMVWLYIQAVPGVWVLIYRLGVCEGSCSGNLLTLACACKCTCASGTMKPQSIPA